MTPDMSVGEMLDRFILIAKGSRVIDRKETSWGKYLWLDDKLVKSMVYSVPDLKTLFAHRVVKSKYAYERRDPLGDWLKHPHKFTAASLFDAMKLADDAARGNVQPRIHLNTLARPAGAPHWVRA